MQRIVAFSSALALLAAACSDNGTTSPSPDIRSFIGGAAAENVDASGHFVLTPHPTAPEITDAQARALATAYVRLGDVVLDLNGTVGGYYALGHGGPVHTDVSVPCGRDYYAASRFEAPGPAYSPQANRYVGGHWVIKFCYGDTYEVVVLVSGLAGSTADGEKLTYQAPQDFNGYGIPTDLSHGVPDTPEDAVLQLAHRTGHLVVTVPELLMPAVGDNATTGIWKMSIDAPVKVQSDAGATWTTSEFYIQRRGDAQIEFLAADPNAPATVPFNDIPKDDQSSGTIFSLVAIKGRPSAFVRAVVLP